MGSGVVFMSEKKSEFARYVGTKLDVEVMPRVKAAAALAGQSVQEWLSDVANERSSAALKLTPVKRKPIPPHPKRNPPRK